VYSLTFPARAPRRPARFGHLQPAASDNFPPIRRSPADRSLRTRRYP